MRVICPDLAGLRALGQADRSRLVHLRPPRRGGPAVLAAPRPERRDRGRAGLGRADRAALGGRERRPRGPARDHEHRAVHRPGEQGLHGLARLRRAQPRPAGRLHDPGRAPPPSCPTRSWPPTRRRFPTPESKAGAAQFPLLVPTDGRRTGRRRDDGRVRRAVALGEARARGVLGLRSGVSLPAAGQVFCDLIPGAGEQVRIEGAAHFLQEDRGERDRRRGPRCMGSRQR